MNNPQNRVTSTVQKQQPAANRLLQLSEGDLDCVLQLLDQRSLFNIAESCSKLCSVVPAHVSQLKARCCTAESYSSLFDWLAHNGSRMNRVTQCSVVGPGVATPACPALDRMPCGNLRQLLLEGLFLQLEAANARPSVLSGCTGLTALHLEHCVLSRMQPLQPSHHCQTCST
jgi:hypothetical protein